MELHSGRRLLVALILRLADGMLQGTQVHINYPQHSRTFSGNLMEI
jgi:hypothetical protein